MTKEELYQFIDTAQRRAARVGGLPEENAPKSMREALDVLDYAITSLLYDEMVEAQLPRTGRRAHLIRALQAWYFLARKQLEVKARTYQSGRKPKLKAVHHKAKVLARYDALAAENPHASKPQITAMLKRELHDISPRTLRSYLSSR